MSERWEAPGGWRIDAISLTGTTGEPRVMGRGEPTFDGDWLRATQHGFHVKDVKTREDLAALGVPVDLLRNVNA